jgi:hypothetical protein
MNIYRISYEYMVYGEDFGYSEPFESSALVVAQTAEAAQLIYPGTAYDPESTLKIKLIGIAAEETKAGILR